MWWDETGLRWVHPSPNMATPEYEEGTSRPAIVPQPSRDLPSVLEFPRAEA